MSGLSPQETVERALAAAKSGDCVVIAEETSTANLRWAGNTLTTNGVTGSRQLTVIAIDRRASGNGYSAATGVVSRAGVRPGQIEDVVREAEHAAAEATRAEDAGELAGAGEPGPFGINATEPGWDAQPGRTEIGVLRDFAATLGQTLRAAEGAGRKLYGFAEHQMESTFLGTSAGLRLRHDQPAGRVELNAKSADMARSAWTGVGTRDFADVDIAGLDAGLAERLGWAERTVSLPAGPVRDPAPAHRSIRPAHLPVLVGRGEGGGRGADRVQQARRRDTGRRAAVLPARDAVQRPPGPGTAVRSVRDRARVRAGLLGLRQRAPARRHLVDPRRLAGRPGLVPALGRARRGPRHPRHRQPDLRCAHSRGRGAGAPGLEQMIASTRRGLLLTCLWYIREVDPQTLLLTGLTRDGVYLVENGEVTGAVNNFRFNESPVGMLGRLLEVGATEPTLPREWGDYFNRAAMPPVRVEGFNMSSVSQAN